MIFVIDRPPFFCKLISNLFEKDKKIRRPVPEQGGVVSGQMAKR